MSEALKCPACGTRIARLSDGARGADLVLTPAFVRVAEKTGAVTLGCPNRKCKAELLVVPSAPKDARAPRLLLFRRHALPSRVDGAS